MRQTLIWSVCKYKLPLATVDAGIKNEFAAYNHLSYHSSFFIEIVHWMINNHVDNQNHGGAFWPCSGVGVACSDVDVGESALFGGGDCQGLFVLGFS